MLSHSPGAITRRMVDAGANIGIIGRHQVVSDLPPHDFLRGAKATGGERTFDQGTRCVLPSGQGKCAVLSFQCKNFVRRLQFRCSSSSLQIQGSLKCHVAPGVWEEIGMFQLAQQARCPSHHWQPSLHHSDVRAYAINLSVTINL